MDSPNAAAEPDGTAAAQPDITPDAASGLEPGSSEPTPAAEPPEAAEPIPPAQPAAAPQTPVIADIDQPLRTPPAVDTPATSETEPAPVAVVAADIDASDANAGDDGADDGGSADGDGDGVDDDEPFADVDAQGIEVNPEALPAPPPIAHAAAAAPSPTVTEPAAAVAASGSLQDTVGETPRDATRPAPKSKDKTKAPKRASNIPDPALVVRRIGTTNEAALRYVLAPDPQLSRLSRKARESLITDVPPVTAGALLGPDALARHFIASAAAGRYRDLFALWDLFRARPDACKPVLAERQRALERARTAMVTAIGLGLRGRAERVVEDIGRAEGLIWTWMRAALTEDLAAVGRRPQVAVALLAREPDLDIRVPARPDPRWLAEAAVAKQAGVLPAAMDEALAANIDRLPATVTTLSLVAEHYPERLETLIDRIDLEADDILATLAWARDHGVANRLFHRVAQAVEAAAADSRAGGLAAWQQWQDRGVDVPLPQSARRPTVEGLDLTRPESATLVASLIAEGAAIDPQAELDGIAAGNRQRAEKVYEAFVCAGLDVHLPLSLEGNPIVRDGTRCPYCQAWTWVRPGHELRCPRRSEEASQEYAGR